MRKERNRWIEGVFPNLRGRASKHPSIRDKGMKIGHANSYVTATNFSRRECSLLIFVLVFHLVKKTNKKRDLKKYEGD